jgi:hypothetical protein
MRWKYIEDDQIWYLGQDPIHDSVRSVPSDEAVTKNRGTLLADFFVNANDGMG